MAYQNVAVVEKWEVQMSISEGILLVFLGINAVSDIRTKKIIGWSAGIFGLFGLLYGFILGGLNLFTVAIALLPGIVFLIIGKLSREAFGYGDGIVVLIMGLYIGIQKLVDSLLIALLLAGVWSIVLMVFLKKKKQAEFPFVPFVLLGYLGGLFI